MTTEDIGNLIYHSALLSGLTVGYSMLLKKIVKIDVGDPSKANLEELAKIIVVVSLAETTREWLIKFGFVPGDIMKA